MTNDDRPRYLRRQLAMLFADSSVSRSEAENELGIHEVAYSRFIGEFPDEFEPWRMEARAKLRELEKTFHSLCDEVQECRERDADRRTQYDLWEEYVDGLRDD